MKKTLQDVIKYYQPKRDNGGSGRRFKVMMRYIVTETLTNVGIIDTAKSIVEKAFGVKSGVTLAVKTGSGKLGTACYNTKEEALDALEKGSYIAFEGATHVAYCENWLGDNFGDIYVVSPKRFMKALQIAGLIRTDTHNGLYRLKMQTFSHMPARRDIFLSYLKEHGETLATFIKRMQA